MTKLLCLENTHNFCYGSAITQEYIAEVKSQISQFNIKLHIDGARIFNAATSLNCSVSTLAQDADSITFCLSKGLSCPSGSLILGTSDFIKKAKKIRKGLGGGMRQAGILASAGIYALDNLTNRLGEDHENALLIAKGLEDVDNIDIDISKVSTNLIFFYLKKNDLSDESFIYKLLENKIKIDSKGNRKFRIATHYGFASDNIERVINTIKSIVNN